LRTYQQQKGYTVDRTTLITTVGISKTWKISATWTGAGMIDLYWDQQATDRDKYTPFEAINVYNYATGEYECANNLHALRDQVEHWYGELGENEFERRAAMFAYYANTEH
jgi:hypothetical protein